MLGGSYELIWVKYLEQWLPQGNAQEIRATAIAERFSWKNRTAYKAPMQIQVLHHMSIPYTWGIPVFATFFGLKFTICPSLNSQNRFDIQRYSETTIYS